MMGCPTISMWSTKAGWPGRTPRCSPWPSLKGVFAAGTEEPVSYVNAPQLAAERGLVYREVTTSTARDYVNLITLRSSEHSLAGTLSGPRSEPRIVIVDDHTVEVPPAEHMLVVRNDDRAGMIGVVGTALGEAGVSISSMAVGPSRTGNTALMVLSTDRSVPDDTFAALGRHRRHRRHPSHHLGVGTCRRGHALPAVTRPG